MAYTPFKMKGPSLYKHMSATKMSHKSATKMADKPKDINKNGKIDGFEQARYDAIKANSPANYGTMKSPVKGYKSDAQRKAVHASKADGGKGAPKYKSPTKVQQYKDKIQKKKEAEKAAFEEKKKAAIIQGKIANWNKKNPKASQEEMNKFIASLK